jgi:hypothetical protein
MRALSRMLAGLALGAVAMPVGATQVCAWMVEKTGADDLHEVELWMQADGEVRFTYQMAGEGMVTPTSRMYSPGSGTYVLHPGVAAKPWGFGATLSPPGKIDMIAEMHAPTKSIFDPPGPLLASFTFRRNLPAGEKKAPPVLAVHQCQTVKS